MLGLDRQAPKGKSLVGVPDFKKSHLSPSAVALGAYGGKKDALASGSGTRCSILIQAPVLQSSLSVIFPIPLFFVRCSCRHLPCNLSLECVSQYIYIPGHRVAGQYSLTGCVKVNFVVLCPPQSSLPPLCTQFSTRFHLIKFIVPDQCLLLQES